MPPDFCLVVASNDADCLKRNLLASEMVVSRTVPVHVERGASSASVAYNFGLAATTAQIVIFAHQDVYFPPGWETRLAAMIAQIEIKDPDWALLAPYGITDKATHAGNVWTTNLNRRIGDVLAHPVLAQSYDELVIVMRRASGLVFDENLPNFHLYGTDIVQTARAQGLGAYVADIPVVHNSVFQDRLGKDFAESYTYIRRKWRPRLPIRTTVLWVTRHGISLPMYQLRAARSFAMRQVMAGNPMTDPKVFSMQCGWE